MSHSPLLSVSDLTVQYALSKGRQLTALKDVSLTLQPGETLAIVGESGCGKSTLARAITGLTKITSGQVKLSGQVITDEHTNSTRTIGKDIQYVFQDPLDALNPSMTIAEILEEPLRNLFPEMNRERRQQKVREAIKDVSLSEEHLQRYPHEFSGGQAQRIGIARALISEPSILICDEPVSALDVSIQAQIINLLKELQSKRNLAMLFISHDLRIVQHIADRVLVLYLGRVMEVAPALELFKSPLHPYTQALLASVPTPDPKQEQSRVKQVQPLVGELPSPLSPPSGCVFITRCPVSGSECKEQVPLLREINHQHKLACFNAE